MGTKSYKIGDVMKNLTKMPVIDPQSGETNIMALFKIRKDGGK